MGLKYLWDTNMAIYYLQDQFSPTASHFIDKAVKEAAPAISVITEIELLCWKAVKQEDLDILKSFIGDCWVLNWTTQSKTQPLHLEKITI